MDAAEALWTVLYRHLNSVDGENYGGPKNTAGPAVRALSFGGCDAWKATESALQSVLVAILTDDGLSMPERRAERVRWAASDGGEGIEYALNWHLANDDPRDYGAPARPVYGVWRFNRCADGTWTQRQLGVLDTEAAAERMAQICDVSIAEAYRATRWHYWGVCDPDSEELPDDNAAYRRARPVDASQICVLL